MGQQVGEAFVRIRPNMSGFKSETESGVKSSFSGLAKIAGLAFGGAAIGELIKNSIESAGQTQAQAHAIRDTFGQAGKAVIGFSKTTGAALGGLEETTGGASVKFGQLFQNLGFGQKQAEQMTVGWEKLGLAINSIRGGGTAGAAETLQQLSLAASGASTRGLNQLGLGISQTTVKAQAFKDGMISTINQALTPAQKAFATFQLATQRLPEYLAQAKSHANDFANVQARLSVEWSNAKTILGEALLPEVTKLVTEFSKWLDKMERSGRLQRDFNEAARITTAVIGGISRVVSSAAHIWESFASAVGGSKNALYGLVGAFAALKGLGIARGIGTSIAADEKNLAGRVKAHIANIKAAQAKAGQTIPSGSPLLLGGLGKVKSVHEDAAKAATSSAAKQISANAAVTASIGKIKTAQDAVTSSAKSSAASVETGIQRFRTALLTGQPLPPTNESYVKALLANAKADAGPFNAKWAAEEKAHIGSVEAASSRIGLTTPAGLAKVEAGIQKFRASLLKGQKVPVNDSYMKALQAQAKASATQISTSFGTASASAKTKIAGIGNAFAPVAAKAQAASRATVGHIGQMRSAMSGFASSASSQASSWAGSVRSASSRAGAAFGAAATGMKIAAIEVGATIKVALIQTGIGLLVVAIGIAVGYIITHWDKVKKYTIALGVTIKAVFLDVLLAVEGYYEALGGVIATSLTAPLRAFLEVASKVTGWLSFLPGVSGLHDKVNEALDFLKKGTTDLVTKGARNVAHGVTSIFGDAKKAWQNALANAGSDPKAAADAGKSGKNWGKHFGDGATTAVTQAIPAMSKTISDALANTIKAAHQAILDSVRSAKDNLDKIGGDLAKTIAKIQDKLGGAAGTIAGSPRGAAFLKLKKLIESGAPSFEIQKAANELRGQLQDAGKTTKKSNVVATQIANLTAAFNKGQIGYKEFEARLHKILRDDGINMATALKKVGPALADTLRAQIRAIQAQAKAIADVPKRFRSVGGAGGAADIKIIRPLEVIKDEQKKVAVAIAKAAQAAQKQRAAQLKAQQHAAQFAQQMATVGVKVISLPAGTHEAGGRHHTSAIGAALGHHARSVSDAVTRHTRLVTAGGASRGPQFRAPTVRTADGNAITGAVHASRSALLNGLRQVCADVIQSGKEIVAAELGLRTPMENLRRTEIRIADHASRQRQTMIRQGTTTNSLLRRLNRTHGPTPGFNKERPGTGGKHARKAAHVGVKP